MLFSASNFPTISTVSGVQPPKPTGDGHGEEEGQAAGPVPGESWGDGGGGGPVGVGGRGMATEKSLTLEGSAGRVEHTGCQE